MDEKELEFYNGVKAYLKETFDIDTQEVYNTHGGHLGVLMRGPYAGHSLFVLISYVAEKEGKKCVYKSDEDY